jgi:ssDNA-binding replication factor A large subunit
MNDIEIIIKNKLKKGDILTTNQGSLRTLNDYIDNKSGKGMLFIGIDKKTHKRNSISKYIYFNEIQEIVNYMKINSTVDFKQVSKFVNANKKGGCITHVAIILICDYLMIAKADYSQKIIAKI